MRTRAAAALLLALAPARAAEPLTVQRFAQPGPLAGVVARVDLRDPRVSLVLALAEGGSGGDCAGRLEVPSAFARRHGFAVTVNASFFTAAPREVAGRTVAYWTGGCARPVGWHVSEGKVLTRPGQPRFKPAVVVSNTGRVSLHRALEEVPADARYAVSGSALVLEGGKVVEAAAGPRHPRTAVGLSEDGRTLLLVAVDGRQEDHSRGATLAELGELMKGLGAHEALNLDGGGSTVMVLKDPATGVFAVANRPSELAPALPGLRLERPVVDVLGVVLREPAPR